MPPSTNVNLMDMVYKRQYKQTLLEPAYPAFSIMLNRSKYLSTSYKDPHQKQNMRVLTKITPPCQEKEGKFMLPAYRLCLVWDEWVPRISTFCGNPTWGKETRRWSTNLCDTMSFYLPVCCMTRQWIFLNLCLPHKYTSQEQRVLPCFTYFMWKRTWSNKKKSN